MRLKNLLILVTLPWLAGCAGNLTERLADRLSGAMLDQTDPEIVRSGAPAYLLLLDALIADDPANPALLLAGANLYGSYATGLVSDLARQKTLTASALEYARRGLCERRKDLCEALDKPLKEFAPLVEQTSAGDLDVLYGYAATRLGWIQVRADDWKAVADLPRVELLFERVLALDPAYERGRAQLYLGALNSLRPAALGGKPEAAKDYFEAAIRYSEGQDLIAKVEYARRYARLVYDRDLHDRLLGEVVAANPRYPGRTLSNLLAQRQAQELLKDRYF